MSRVALVGHRPVGCGPKRVTSPALGSLSSLSSRGAGAWAHVRVGVIQRPARDGGRHWACRSAQAEDAQPEPSRPPASSAQQGDQQAGPPLPANRQQDAEELFLTSKRAEPARTGGSPTPPEGRLLDADAATWRRLAKAAVLRAKELESTVADLKTQLEDRDRGLAQLQSHLLALSNLQSARLSAAPEWTDDAMEIEATLATLCTQLAELGLKMSQRGVQISERNVQLSDRGMQLCERALQLVQRNAQLSESCAQHSERGVQLAERNVQLSAIGIQLAGLQLGAHNEKDAEVRRVEEQLAGVEQETERRMAEVRRLEAALQANEEQLRQRREQLQRVTGVAGTGAPTGAGPLMGEPVMDCYDDQYAAPKPHGLPSTTSPPSSNGGGPAPGAGLADPMAPAVAASPPPPAARSASEVPKLAEGSLVLIKNLTEQEAMSRYGDFGFGKLDMCGHAAVVHCLSPNSDFVGVRMCNGGDVGVWNPDMLEPIVPGTRVRVGAGMDEDEAAPLQTRMRGGVWDPDLMDFWLGLTGTVERVEEGPDGGVWVRMDDYDDDCDDCCDDYYDDCDYEGDDGGDGGDGVDGGDGGPDPDTDGGTDGGGDGGLCMRWSPAMLSSW